MGQEVFSCQGAAWRHFSNQEKMLTVFKFNRKNDAIKRSALMIKPGIYGWLCSKK